MTREFKPMLTLMGQHKLEAAGLPTDFNTWLELVRKELNVEYVNKRIYARHYTNGAPPKEAVALVEMDDAADEMVRDVVQRINADSTKRNFHGRVRYGTQYLLERVALQLQQCV